MMRRALIQYVGIAALIYAASTIFINIDWWMNGKRLVDHAFMLYTWIIVIKMLRHLEVSSGLVLAGISYITAKEIFNVGDSLYTTCLNFINPDMIDDSFNSYRCVCTIMAISAGMLLFFSLLIGVSEDNIDKQPWLIRKIYNTIKDRE